MELNRNHWLMIGIVLLLLGLQMRRVESVTLTREFTAFLARHVAKNPLPPSDGTNRGYQDMLGDPQEDSVVSATKTVKPPRWIGYALLSVGGVMVFHSLAMPRPS